MDRFVVYTDISPGYVVYDTLSESVAAVYHHHYRDAERAAERMNGQPFHLGSRPDGALARTATAPAPRYVVRPGFRDYQWIVLDQWTLEIVWGPTRNMRAEERLVAGFSNEHLTGGIATIEQDAAIAGRDYANGRAPGVRPGGSWR